MNEGLKILILFEFLCFCSIPSGHLMEFIELKQSTKKQMANGLTFFIAKNSVISKQANFLEKR